MCFWSSSGNQRKGRFVSEIFSHAKDWTSLDKAPCKAAGESSVLRRVMNTLHLSRTECAMIEGWTEHSAEQFVVTVLRFWSVTEDGHAGSGARATSNAQRSSAPREHTMFFMRTDARVVTSRLLCKDDLGSQGSVWSTLHKSREPFLLRGTDTIFTIKIFSGVAVHRPCHGVDGFILRGWHDGVWIVSCWSVANGASEPKPRSPRRSPLSSMREDTNEERERERTPMRRERERTPMRRGRERTQQNRWAREDTIKERKERTQRKRGVKRKQEKRGEKRKQEKRGEEWGEAAEERREGTQQRRGGKGHNRGGEGREATEEEREEKQQRRKERGKEIIEVREKINKTSWLPWMSPLASPLPFPGPPGDTPRHWSMRTDNPFFW